MDITLSISYCLQKARLARIRMAKNASGAAFIDAKKKNEQRIAQRESGLEVEELKEEDMFALQHHHLLTCLEKTTVSHNLIKSYHF